MSVETKILLTINFEGGALHRSVEGEKKEAVLTKKDLNPNYNREDKNKIVRKVKYMSYPLVATPSSLTIKMCREAYDYMTSTETPGWFIPNKPSKERFKLWRKMSPNERLEMHLALTCEHHHGKSFTYSIVED